jgi:multisubunit Na+/H+ antiporter MnhB subunit
MTEQELEHLLLENLKYARENREYLRKIDRRQRWQRNWTAFYWTVLILLAIGGYYYAFPYLQVIKDQLNEFAGQFGSIVNLVTPTVKQ